MQLHFRRLTAAWKRIVAQWTIQHEISLAILVTTLIPLLISTAYLYRQLDLAMKERVVQYSNEVVRQAGESIERIRRQTMLVKTQLVNWTIVNKLLEADLTPEERFQRSTATRDFIINLGITYPFVSSIYIVSENGNVYTGDYYLNRERLLMQPWIEAIASKTHAEILIPPHPVDYRDPILRKSGTLVFSYVKQIVDYTAGARSGVLQIDIRYDSIVNLIEKINLGDESALLLIDGESRGLISKHPGVERYEDEVHTLLGLAEGGTIRSRDLVIKHRLSGIDWYLVGVIPAANMLEDFRILQRVTVVTILTLAVLSVFAGLMLASRITRPLTIVVERINKLGHGDFSQRVPDFANRDLHILSLQFNQMADRIENLMHDAVQREKEKDQAELRALEAQINPHFLYNTLEVIRGISLEYQVPHISAIAKSLASIFRYSIKREHERVPLSRELMNVRNYITIQEQRYRRRFTYTEAVPDDLREIMVIRLILQPLVENIFAHVVEKRSTSTAIEISAEQSGKCLRIMVSDDGPGLDPDVHERINRALLIGAERRFSWEEYGLGIGLINVHNRIGLRFGREWGLTLPSSTQGTLVIINLPLDQSGPE